MSYAADFQNAVLGRLLMDIVHGDLTDTTIDLVDQLDTKKVPMPMNHLVSFVQGMAMAPDRRPWFNRVLLDELRIITIDQQEDLYPLPKDKLPQWKPDAPLPERAMPIIKDLLLEILQGKVRSETLTAIDDLGELEDVPEPYQQLLSLPQSFREDGLEIADLLFNNLSGILDVLKLLRR